ncbi:MAG: 3'(2'),5'-bisphosphate nucleotidase CysQ [Cardiobacteriaceae bacterium]|nr:3'(2'),5'-bisphosphate nucleotidase CysQ [Cardiobacteriaceae bacterium]
MLNIIDQQIITAIAALCQKAGAAILSFYDKPESYQIHNKDNHTPLTDADIVAHNLLLQGLPQIIDIPCLSEESDATMHAHPPSDYWLIDPIDGTREFIEHSGQFCIAIARIQAHRPTLGFIYAPVSGEYWYALAGKGAYKCDKYLQTHRLQCRIALTQQRITIITARKKLKDQMLSYLATNFGAYEHICQGSALKFCSIAEGKADLYPKLVPKTSQWDIAAGDLLLHEAGGGLRLQGNQLARYGLDENTLNPPFLAFGAGFNEAKLKSYFATMQEPQH